jgi:glucose-1-phosphate thymidylyltransferase
MIERIIETITAVLLRGFEEAVFILGPDFGHGIREELTAVCKKQGIPASFAVQDRALGTAHAVIQAGDRLSGECVIIFADTLFEMESTPDLEAADAVIWVKHVDDPRRFGVVVKDDSGKITDFVEKPSEPISNEAIIGIYYVKDGDALRGHIQHLIDNEVQGAGGEYQLTDALDRMLKDGAVFHTASVSEWLDAGTIPALMDTTRVVLEKEQGEDGQGRAENSQIHEPVYLGPDVVVKDSEIGPNVAVHEGARIEGSTVKDTIVFAHAEISDAELSDSVVGRHAVVRGISGRLNIGDHSEASG